MFNYSLLPKAALKALRSWGKEERLVLGASTLRIGLAVAGLALVPLLALHGRSRFLETGQRLSAERREPLAVVLATLASASRVARDWGQWDQIRDYVLQPTPGPLPEPIEPTSVLEIGRVMAVVHDSGRVLFIRGGDGDPRALHRSLLSCARPNLAALEALKQVRLLACRDARGFDYLGAATRVTNSAKTLGAPAVMLFFVPLHTLELGPAINTQVYRLSRDFAWAVRPTAVGASAQDLPPGLEPLGFPDPVYGPGGRQLMLRQPSAQGPALELLGRDLALAALVLALALSVRMLLMLERRRVRLQQRQIERRGNTRIRRLSAELESLLDGVGMPNLAANRSDRVLARLMQAAPGPDDDTPAGRGGAAGQVLEERMQRLISRFQAVLVRAKALALLDPLTGLPNRRYFIEHLQLELDHSRQGGGPASSPGAEGIGVAVTARHAILFVDIDRFKAINDSYGHRTGDAVLKAVAARLQRLIPPGDFLARYGGDEMAILHDLQSLQGKPIELQRQALGQWAETLLSAFRTPLPLEGLELTISISLGVHLLDSAQDDGSEALKCADLAMVRAKGKRHRQIVVFDRQHDSADLNSYQLYVDLIQAIQDQQLTMLFQPIFGPSGQVHAVEALARWTHPQLGVIPTETFLALAEQHRDMVFLGEELLRLALEGFRRIHARDASIRLALNLHPSKLLDPELVSRLLARLEQIHLPSSCLTVELTEQSVLEPGPAVERNLRQLREQGISLSLDDFGTGYSSLVLISRLRPDELKIDRSFAQAMLRDDYASQIVSLITTMAGSLDLELVAEGVDSAEVLEALRALGVQRFQGFLLARPMPEAELLERLDGRGFDFPDTSALAQIPQG